MPVVRVNIENELMEELVRKYRKNVSESILTAVEEAIKKKGVEVSTEEIMEALDRHFIQIAKEIREFLSDFVKHLSEKASVKIEYSGEIKSMLEAIENRISDIESSIESNKKEIEERIESRIFEEKKKLLRMLDDSKTTLYEHMEEVKKQVKYNREKISNIEESLMRAHRSISGVKGFYSKEVSPIFLEVKKKIADIENIIREYSTSKDEVERMKEELNSVALQIQNITDSIEEVKRKIKYIEGIGEKEQQIILLALDFAKDKIKNLVSKSDAS